MDQAPSTDKDLVLTICPPFSPEIPHIGLSYLAEYMEHSGFSVDVFDISLEIYRQMSQQDRVLWKSESWPQWQHEPFIDDFWSQHEDILNDCLDRLLARGPRVVGFSVLLFNAMPSMYLIQQVRQQRPETVIIAGGPAFFRHQEDGEEQIRLFGYPVMDNPSRRKRLQGWLEDLDLVVFDEGEETLLEVMRRVQDHGDLDGIQGTGAAIDGQHRIQPPRPLIKDLSRLPYPSLRQFDLENYTGEVLPIQTARGCINRCTCCVEHHRWGHRVRMRDLESVIAEIQNAVETYSCTRFKLYDMLLNPSIRRMKSFCELLLEHELEIRWGGNMVVNEKMDADFFRLCKSAGAHTFTFGVESGSPRVLDLIGKKFSIKAAEQNLQDCHDAGIKVFINLVVGFPGETEEDFQQTLGFLFRNADNIDMLNVVRTCIIYHHTDLHKDPERFGLDQDQVELLPHYFGMRDWEDENKMDLAERDRRYQRLVDAAVRIGVGMFMDVDTYRLPPTWDLHQAVLEREDDYRWLELLRLSELAAGYPVETVITLALEHSSPKVRAGGAVLAGMLRHASVERLLKKNVCEDESDNVRETCARALGLIGKLEYAHYIEPLLQDYDNLKSALKRDLRGLYEKYIHQDKDSEDG